jgi:hypothetical protein
LLDHESLVRQVRHNPLDDHECGEAKNIKPPGVGYHYVVPIWQSFILGNIERHLHTPCQPSEHSHEHEQHSKHGLYGLNARPADHEPTNLMHALSKLGAENMIYYLLALQQRMPNSALLCKRGYCR